MKNYVMNKEVRHNGKHYVKGQTISKNDEGFTDIVNAGHADIKHADDGQPKVETQSEASPEAEVEQPAQAESATEESTDEAEENDSAPASRSRRRR